MNTNGLDKRHQEIKTHFDRLSSGYPCNFSDKKSGKNYQFRTRLELVSSLAKGAKGSLLDCACGSGEITADVLKAGSFNNAIVADISGKMLGLAQSRIAEAASSSDVQYQQVNIFDYKPVEGQQFNLVLCLGLVAHTGALTELLAHLSTMLAPGGKIILQSSLLDHWGIRFVRFLTQKKYRQRHGYGIHYFALVDIKKSIARSGLKISSLERYGFSLPFADSIFPLGNYLLEAFMKPFSARFGAEAIFVLTH